MIERIEPLPGQESAWDYPRSPMIERTRRHIIVKVGGMAVADTTQAQRLLERAHPPVYFIPAHHVRLELLTLNTIHTEREHLGTASYYDLSLDGRVVTSVACVFTDPAPGFESLRGHLAFHAGRVDDALVDGERATPQPGSFYWGWITKDVAGRFKGEPGSWGW